MNRALWTSALLVLTAMTAACSLKIFEDVGSNPHPPLDVEVTSLVYYVPPPPGADRAASSPQVWSNGLDPQGFTLTTDQQFQIWVAYTDAGGDIVKFQLRDRDGSLNVEFPPHDRTYFSGISGAVLVPATGIDDPPEGIKLTGIVGPHRLEFWAEDSHLSRSEKVEFVITLVDP